MKIYDKINNFYSKKRKELSSMQWFYLHYNSSLPNLSLGCGNHHFLCLKLCKSMILKSGFIKNSDYEIVSENSNSQTIKTIISVYISLCSILAEDQNGSRPYE